MNEMSQETADLRRALRLDGDTTLYLPDPGERAMVVMRYKGVELSFLVNPEYFDCDEILTTSLLKMRDCFNILEKA